MVAFNCNWFVLDIYLNLYANLVSFALRLLTIYVPIKSQRNTALQSKYRKELKEFKERMDDAKAENDQMQGLFNCNVCWSNF
jgi:hypothetical protein